MRQEKLISFLKWFGLVWVVANYALIELLIAWRDLGWPPMLNNLLPLKRGDPMAALIMAPGIIALIIWPVLLIRQKKQKRDSARNSESKQGSAPGSTQ